MRLGSAALLLLFAGCAPHARSAPAPAYVPVTKPVVIGVIYNSLTIGARVGGKFGIPEGSSAVQDYRWADNIPLEWNALTAAAVRGAFAAHWRVGSGAPASFVLESNLVDLAYDTWWDGSGQVTHAKAHVKVDWTMHVNTPPPGDPAPSILVSTTGNSAPTGYAADRLAIGAAFEDAFAKMAADPAITAALRE